MQNWDIREFYQKSWDLIKANKKLLILGIAVAIFASGGSNSYRGFGGSDSDKKKDADYEEFEHKYDSLENPYDTSISPDEDLDFGVEKVLGETEEAIESKTLPTFFQKIIQGFKQVPIGVYVLLGFEILIYIIALIIFGIIVRAWAVGALIRGIFEADTGAAWGLFGVTREAWKKVKSVIWLTLVPWLAFVAVLLGSIIVLAILGAISTLIPPLVILLIIAGIVGTIAFVYFAIKIGATQTLGLRFIMIDNLSGKDAFKKGYQTIKGNLLKMMRLGIANTLLSCGVSCGIMIPIGIVFAIAAATIIPQLESDEPISTLLMIFGGIVGGAAIFIAILTFMAASAFLKTFTFAAWHYAFNVLKAIKGDTNEQQ